MLEIESKLSFFDTTPSGNKDKKTILIKTVKNDIVLL
jgi:hypothetical protein